MAVRIQIRRDTSSNWSTVNPVLRAGEFGVETDTNQIKIGNGSLNWNSLSYATQTPEGVTDAINTAINNLVDGAPSTLNTLKELALAIGNDANFSSTITTALSQKANTIYVNSVVSGAIDTANQYTDDAITFAINALTTSDIEEGSNLYFTDERAQDAVANALIADSGINIVYSDSSNQINISNSGVLSFNTRTGNITLTDTDVNNALGYTAANAADLTTLGNNLSSDITDAITTANNYTDAAIEQEVLDRNIAIGVAEANGQSYANTKKSEAISASETYTDNQITNLINSAPSTLDTLNELATALGNDPNFATTIANNLAGKQDKVTGVSDTEISYLDGVTSSIQNQIDGKISASSADTLTNKTISSTNNTITVTSSNVSDFTEAAQDAVGNALGTGLSYNDNTGAISVTPNTYDSYGSAATAETNAKNYADGLAVNYDAAGSAATAESNANSFTTSAINALTTDDIEEGSTNKYFTVERAQDAIGNSLGTGLSYDDGTGAISVTTNTYDAYGSASTAQSNAELYTDNKISTEVTNRNNAIATAKSEAISTANNYTDGKIATEVSDRNSAISTAINALTTSDIEEGSNLYFTDERAQDAVNAALVEGTGISKVYDDNANTITLSNTGVVSLAGTANEITASASSGSVTLSLPSNVILPGTLEVSGNATIDGNLTVKGTTTTVNTQTVTTQDNLLYLNADVEKTILNASHNTTTVTYEVNDLVGLQDGMYVSIYGITPSEYNISYSDNIIINSTNIHGGKHYITVTKTVTGSYTSGGTLSARFNTNPDLGFAGGYFDTTYQHAGLFRDASDAGTFKVFQGYTPEPDASPNIDTTHPSFAFAPLKASTITATSGFSGNLTGNVTGNADTATKLATARNINGVAFDGTADITIKASTTNPLTIGTGLTGTSFDGGTAVTIEIDSTVTTNSGAQTLTNKVISGSSNTITNIGNSSLTNSKVTVGTTDISLGASSTTLAGLTSVSSTTFTGNLTGDVTGNVSGNAGTVTNGVYTTDTGTVTNTMLAGSIANNKLANSKITIGTTEISLGGTGTTLAGLSSVTATTFTGSLVGNASTVTNGVYTTDTGTVTNTMLAGSIANNKLTNSSITVNGNTVSLGGSTTVTAVNPNALTIGTGLSGTSYDGSSAVTVAIDSSVVTLTGSQTLTNKTLTSPVIATISNTGTLTLPTSSDTLVGRATTDTFTNKTFDTAGDGNVLKINGTTVSAVTGTGSVVLSASPTFTGTVNAAAVTTTGNLIVGGDLTVNGTTTTLNTSTLQVADSNIEIAKVATPTDVTANGAGITVKGATDKTLNWYSSTGSFTSSENVDVVTGKTYKIAGTDVLTSTQVLGKSLPAGTVVGTTDAQTLTNKTISGSSNTITNIANSSLTNSTISGVSLGSNLNALTIGTGLSGSSYNGSTGVTIAIDSSVVTLTGSQTLTNKTLTSPVIATITNTGTLTLPTSTDTLVGRATTDTFTNKTFDTAGTGNVFRINGTAVSAVTGTGSAVLATSPTVTGLSTDTLTVTGSSAPTNGLYLPSANTVGIASNSTQRMTFDANGSINFAGQLLEAATISSTAAATTVTYDVITNKNVLYYTSNASANWTLNVRGNSSVSLNTLMATGQSLTVVFMVTNGATAYYQTAFQIDGNAVTPKWSGGTAPTSGNTNSIDIYTFNIIKTGSAAFTVLGSQTKFA